MCTKSQLEAIEEEMVNYYRSVYGDSIDTIILYGSYARGDYSDDSDIDITAIVRGNRVELQKKFKEKLPYYRNIVKEGRKIGWSGILSDRECTGKTGIVKDTAGCGTL